MRTAGSGDREKHLTDGELFTLASPPAGEPEALPGHLSECLSCSRSLSEWKSAVRELAEQDTSALSRRSDEEWEALEEKTLDAIRRSRVGRQGPSWRWMAAVAAAIVLVALLLPLRKGSAPVATSSRTASADLSAQDQADDALLRDVARLSRGDDGTGGSWSTFAPDPEAGSDKDRL